MDADGTNGPQGVPQETEEQPTTASRLYMVARSAAEMDNVNTIDIIGEKPFSV